MGELGSMGGELGAEIYGLNSIDWKAFSRYQTPLEPHSLCEDMSCKLCGYLKSVWQKSPKQPGTAVGSSQIEVF